MAKKKSKSSGLPEIPKVSEMPNLKEESFIKKNKKLLFKIWVPVSLVIVFLLLVPTKTVIRDVEISYTGEENYTAEIPYEEEVPIKIKYWELGGPDCVEDPNCLCIKRSVTTDECIRCSCNVDINSTREVPSYTVLTVMKNVTKYRYEDSTRTTAKTRMEKQEFEVNWVFGHRMPFKLHLPLISG